MRHLRVGLIAILLASSCTAAFAQTIPGVIDPVPAPRYEPLPVPQAPVINGPLSNQQPRVYQPPQRRTFQDRVKDCLEASGGRELPLGETQDSYVRSCAN